MDAPSTSPTPTTTPDTGAHPEPDPGFEGHLVTSPAPGPPLISTDAATRALCDYFLVNADRGDHAANDELVAALVGRMRTGQTCGGGASRPMNTAVLSHRARGVQ